MNSQTTAVQRIKDFAHGLGFDFCGVTTAEAPERADYFRNWLGDGKHGSMQWLEKNAAKRVNPLEVLPGAKSIIVVGLNYGDDDLAAQIVGGQKSPVTGQIARYARGVDYHDIMWGKLRGFEEFISGQFAAETLSYVDTGPVLERDLAARAGIGWQGKSTMLISPTLGTYFFIGELLTTLELEPDAPQKDRCGTCSRCISACPTGAITAPYQMDARLCISYQTIENKGVIPEGLRSLMGDRIYGCDDCLAACPWNRFARASQEAQFAGNEWTRRPSLRKLLALGEEDFRTLYRASPVKRIKRRGLLRNVCVALGNTGTQDDLPALKKALEDPEPLVKEHALWAIHKIQQRPLLTQ
ncbi:MAG: tRNA epoxyqueuosine(34) reductase QueG [Verrucomicrobiota bacterium]|nr:tRNA epoxyqueuosine(34) reductase QueG [Verrucomicrobiota bacterium]